jgi:hypothetical protein
VTQWSKAALSFFFIQYLDISASLPDITSNPQDFPRTQKNEEEHLVKHLTRISGLALFTALAFAASTVLAQDPVKVDPKHYKVEFENDHVRVLRITYGPDEKSVMHDHPDGTAVFLTDYHVKFTYPDGKIDELKVRQDKPNGPKVESIYLKTQVRKGSS